jgi:hypothetical protein
MTITLGSSCPISHQREGWFACFTLDAEIEAEGPETRRSPIPDGPSAGSNGPGGRRLALRQATK